MNKRLKILIPIFLLIAIPVCPLILRDPILKDRQEVRYPDVLFSSFSNSGTIKFDSRTILDSLRQENKNVFSPIDESSGPHTYEAPFVWKQADYFLIAKALHQHIWEESLDDWSLHSMSFYGECSDEIGFDIVVITYYKLTSLQKYSVHQIGIYPRVGEGEWGEGNGYDRSLFLKWANIDLEKLLLTTEDVLQLAEDNGGSKARISVGNQCRINLSLGPYPYPGWSVSYELPPTRIFEIEINAYSDDYKILNP
ncbi:MAG: hypothetical protein FJZ87_00045 [Chloroflexi bacterium]|nr:hypothetical protein [Chloroflexota bacterium]